MLDYYDYINAIEGVIDLGVVTQSKNKNIYGTGMKIYHESITNESEDEADENMLYESLEIDPVEEGALDDELLLVNI